MHRTTSKLILSGIILIVCLAPAGAGNAKGKEKAKPKGKASTEAVWVINSIDNTGRNAFVVRSTGKVFKVRKGSGCASIRAYDSQKLPLVSPGSFLAAGSYIDILQEGEKCEIAEAVELKKGDLHAVATELDERKAALVKKFQEALSMLGKYGGDINGQLDGTTTAAFKAFQKGRGLKPTGDVGPEFILELFVVAQKKDDLAILTHLSKTLWPYAQAI